MNGVHDMGGSHGHGPVASEKDEPIWHDDWEARMFGIAWGMTFPEGFSIDRFRHFRELLQPPLYLARAVTTIIGTRSASRPCWMGVSPPGTRSRAVAPRRAV